MFVSTKSHVYSDDTGAYVEIPALLTPQGPLLPLLDYCLAHSHDRSISWMENIVRSVKLFLDYLECNPTEKDAYIVFQNFGLRLYTGTFDPQSGLDPSGLAWPARSNSVSRKIIRGLTDFFQWLGPANSGASQINPKYSGGAYDRKCDEAAYQFRRNRAFLGHVWAPHLPENRQGHRFRPERSPKVDKASPPAFPDDRFMEFLIKGFSARGKENYRDMLITLLLHGGGFRESEPFHLYFEDVFPDPKNPDSAIVLIHHPSQGQAPVTFSEAGKSSSFVNRCDYLARRFALSPRNKIMGARSSGWKGGIHDAKFYKKSHWFRPEFGVLFWKIWQLYLQQVVGTERHHPFAFINLKSGKIGAQYCRKQFLKAHARAVRRIGLPVGRNYGTTPHGHRHAYAQRLLKAGVPPEIIRKGLHHSSLSSQEVYTQPGVDEVYAELAAADERMRAKSLPPKSMEEVPLLSRTNPGSQVLRETNGNHNPTTSE